MLVDKKIETFLSQYDDRVFNIALELRRVLLYNLPDIIEEIDKPAKMIAYCYGRKYVEMICVIIPSKKGIKLSFYKGIDLPDPDNLLRGKGKNSRYVEVTSEEQIKSIPLKQLIKSALQAYKKRVKNL